MGSVLTWTALSSHSKLEDTTYTMMSSASVRCAWCTAQVRAPRAAGLSSYPTMTRSMVTSSSYESGIAVPLELDGSIVIDERDDRCGAWLAQRQRGEHGPARADHMRDGVCERVEGGSA